MAAASGVSELERASVAGGVVKDIVAHHGTTHEIGVSAFAAEVYICTRVTYVCFGVGLVLW